MALEVAPGGKGTLFGVFPAQLAVSAIVWAATIALLLRRREALLARMGGLSRGRRAGVALGLLAASVVALLLGMGALALGGLTPRGLSWWGWPLITLVGAAFVVLQTVALVPLGLNAAEPVTREGDGSSDSMDADRP